MISYLPFLDINNESLVHEIGNWFGRGVFYKGRIAKANKDFTYDVAYDDGDREENVHRKRIKYLRLNIGEKVLGNFLGDGVWYRGRIENARGNLYDIAYNDGDREKNVLPENVRRDMISLYTGERVWANWKGLGAYYKGRVVKIDAEKYSIQYDDGDFEEKVPRRRLKTETYYSLQRGQRVLGKYQNTEEFFPGYISNIALTGGTDITEKEYEIRYDDGDTEKKITIDRITPLEDGGVLRVGQEILGKYRFFFLYFHLCYC